MLAIAALLMSVVLPASAAQLQGAPRLSLPSAPLGAPAAALPLPSAAPLYPGTNAAPPAPPTLPGAALGLPAAAPPAAPAAPKAAGDLRHLADMSGSPAPKGAPASARARSSAESEAAAGTARFDGAAAKRGRASDGWTVERFESAADGAPIAYKRRAGSDAAPARVFAGGLALNESFEALFAARRGPGHEYFVWTRGHPPSAWTPTRSPIDADARDLARLIVKAAAASKTGKAELALHSFGTLVFQRLVQLRGEPEIDAALQALRGSRVFLVNATTHYEGSERRAGPQYEQMSAASQQFVAWLDMMDGVAAEWEAALRLNPFLGPTVGVWLANWRAQRAQALALASAQAAAAMKKDLEASWPAGLEPIRRRLAAGLESDHRDSGWQEALLRRSADAFRLEFTKKDAAAIRRAGIELELVHALEDQLLNWASARALFARLGIRSPKDAPAAGTALTDASGAFRARVVEGDHYFPLKRHDELARIMAR